MTATGCFRHDELTDYLAGKGENGAVDVEAHLRQCERCRSLLAACDSSDDDFVRSVRRAVQIPLHDHEPELARAVEAIVELGGGQPDRDSARARHPPMH